MLQSHKKYFVQLINIDVCYYAESWILQWIIFQTYFNSGLFLHPYLPYLTLFNTSLTLK